MATDEVGSILCSLLRFVTYYTWVCNSNKLPLLRWVRFYVHCLGLQLTICGYVIVMNCHCLGGFDFVFVARICNLLYVGL